MARRYILFANLIPLAVLLALVFLFVPAGERFFLIFTALVISVGWALLIFAFSGSMSVFVWFGRLFDRKGARDDFGRKTLINPDDVEHPSDKWLSGKD